MFLLQTKQLKGFIITVSGVKISSDLSIASVYLSIFPSEKGEETIKNINANVKEIRYDFGQRVRHQLKIIPELRFFLDTTLEYMAHIDELLKQ